MRKKINSAIFHFKVYLFKKWGYPRVWNDQISKQQLKKYLPNNPIIIDCGAHDGSDTIELAKLFPRGKVHSFEPIPALYQRLSAKANSFNNINTYPIALADLSEIKNFYVSNGDADGASSLLPPGESLTSHPGLKFSEPIQVQALSLDDWALQNNISSIDLLWLDMQGFEKQMLQQSKQLLSTVKVIHTEVSAKNTYEGLNLYPEYRKFLEGIGFKVLIEAIPCGWDMGNVLFVRS